MVCRRVLNHSSPVWSDGNHGMKLGFHGWGETAPQGSVYLVSSFFFFFLEPFSYHVFFFFLALTFFLGLFFSLFFLFLTDSGHGQLFEKTPFWDFMDGMKLPPKGQFTWSVVFFFSLERFSYHVFFFLALIFFLGLFFSLFFFFLK